MNSVYLSGLIDPNCPETLVWRKDCTRMLEEYFFVLDPTRGKHFDKDKACIRTSGMLSDNQTPREAILQDYNDVMVSYVVLANLNRYGSARPLVGTLYELAWAWQEKKPVIAVYNEDDVKMLEHPFISETSVISFTLMDDAVEHLIRYYSI